MPKALLDTEEMQTKVPMATVGFLVMAFVAVATMGFFLGVTVKETEKNHEQQKILHGFAIDEVSGLRSDWERQNKINDKEVEQLKNRIEKLENRLK